MTFSLLVSPLSQTRLGVFNETCIEPSNQTWSESGTSWVDSSSMYNLLEVVAYMTMAILVQAKHYPYLSLNRGENRRRLQWIPLNNPLHRLNNKIEESNRFTNPTKDLMIKRINNLRYLHENPWVPQASLFVFSRIRPDTDHLINLMSVTLCFMYALSKIESFHALQSPEVRQALANKDLETAQREEIRQLREVQTSLDEVSDGSENDPRWAQTMEEVTIRIGLLTDKLNLMDPQPQPGDPQQQPGDPQQQPGDPQPQPGDPQPGAPQPQPLTELEEILSKGEHLIQAKNNTAQKEDEAQNGQPQGLLYELVIKPKLISVKKSTIENEDPVVRKISIVATFAIAWLAIRLVRFATKIVVKDITNTCKGSISLVKSILTKKNASPSL